MFNYSRRSHHERAGFTLLEMLIVGVLTGVLMLGVWSLFRTWGRLYERGEQRVMAAQLVRSLCDQFSDDVRSVAYVAPPKRRGSSSRSGFSGGSQALVGGSDWLVLEVLQPPNPFLLSNSADNSERIGEESGMLAAPELQRVIYTFQPPVEELDSLSAGVAELADLDDTELVGDEEELEEPFSGLLRLVIPTEQFDQLTAGSAEAGSVSRRTRRLSDAAWQLRELAVGVSEYSDSSSSLSFTDTTMTGDSDDAFAGSMAKDEVPEVIWFELRYFDGSSWTSSWDSRSHGRLPVAIEMRFELKKEETEEESLIGDGETELVDDGLSESDSLDEYLSPEFDVASPSDMTGMGGESYEETPYQRCVVFLGPGGE